MSDWKENLKHSLRYVQDNAKAILLVLNAIVVVVLLYFAASQAIFELRVHGLVKKALVLHGRASQPDDKDDPKGSPGKPGDRMSTGGPARPTAKPGASPTSPTLSSTTASSPTTSDARPGSGTLAADGPTSGSQATSATIALNPGDGMSGTTESVATNVASITTSGTIPSSPTAVLALDEPPLNAEVSTRTVAAVRGAVGRVAKAWAGIKKTLGSSNRNPAAGPPKPRGHAGGKPGPKKPSDPKQELFKKMQQRALFGGPKPTVHNPVFTAVLGDKAMIDNKWLGVGEKAGAYEVVSITASTAVLKDAEGNERTLSLGPGGGAGPRPGGPPRPGSPTPPRGAPPPPPGGPPTAEIRGSPGSGFDPSRIPDAMLEQLTRPGGPLEGMSPSQIRSMSPNELRSIIEARSGRMRSLGGSRSGLRRERRE